MGNPFDKGGDEVEPPKIEDIIPYLEAQQQLNQVDQVTPWGSVKYDTVYNEPLGYDAWYSQQNPSIFSEGVYRDKPAGHSGGGDRHMGNGWDFSQPNNQWQGVSYERNPSNPQNMYDDYLANFDKGLGETTATHTFSDEVQGLWDKQWEPDSYQNYSDDYMDRYSELMQPDRDYRADRFQQNMFDRGLPEGSDVYGDLYRQTVGDPNARQDTMAAQQAANAADAARLQDYNRLASAFGMAQLPVPGVDVMGPANMFMNASQINAQNANQGASDFWNAAGLLGGGIFGGGKPWWMG